jgi:hypothetical protein
MLALGPLLLALVQAVADGSASTVTPFRTDAGPRVDPVFGDVGSMREAIDQFLQLDGEMEKLRDEFSTAVHDTMAQLGPMGSRPSRTCPASIPSSYVKALEAGRRFLAYGRRLEARFREIRRADDLGDTVGLTPDYRLKTKRVRELYAALLRDYREMRVAFYDQLGAEMRHAGCKVPLGSPAALPPVTLPPASGVRPERAAPDPANPADWELEAAEAPPPGPGKEPPGGHPGKAPLTPAAPGAGPAIWIEIDNTRCARPSTLTLDGALMGPIAAQKKVSVRTHAGPHELCVLPAADKRACGAPGTIRRAYLYEGWTLAVRCEK